MVSSTRQTSATSAACQPHPDPECQGLLSMMATPPPIFSPQVSASHNIFLRLVILTSDKQSSRKKPGHPRWSVSSPVLPVLVPVLFVVVQSPSHVQLCAMTSFRLLWNFPGKHTGVGCHFLLQGTFPTQGSYPHLLHWQVASLPPEPPGKLCPVLQQWVFNAPSQLLIVYHCSSQCVASESCSKCRFFNLLNQKLWGWGLCFNKPPGDPHRGPSMRITGYHHRLLLSIAITPTQVSKSCQMVVVQNFNMHLIQKIIARTCIAKHFVSVISLNPLLQL